MERKLSELFIGQFCYPLNTIFYKSKFDSNHTSISSFQSINIYNVTNFAISPITNIYIIKKLSLASYLDNYKTKSNLNVLSTRFKALSKTILDILLVYKLIFIITKKLLLQNTLNIMKLEVLPKNNNYFL